MKYKHASQKPTKTCTVWIQLLMESSTSDPTEQTQNNVHMQSEIHKGKNTKEFSFIHHILSQIYGLQVT